ncbi:hypothetical protein FRB96_009503 [Tulasnella sp. 330]|nr:hypothetical protein FRB96_009503 [Tulasnella sp. 330]KAG8873486.1 hypothetical protein FRB97_006717 [Tulasnella sp. 331]
MFVSAFLFAIAAVPALSAPTFTPSGLVARGNGYTTWDDTALWLQGMAKIQEFEDNEFVDDAEKATISDTTNGFTSAVAKAVEAQGGHVYFVGPWKENYQNAVNEYAGLTNKNPSAQAQLAKAQQALWVRMETDEWNVIIDTAEGRIPPPTSMIVVPGTHAIKAAVAEFLEAGQLAMNEHNGSFTNQPAKYEIGGSDKRWVAVCKEIISTFDQFTPVEFETLDAIKAEVLALL